MEPVRLLCEQLDFGVLFYLVFLVAYSSLNIDKLFRDVSHMGHIDVEEFFLEVCLLAEELFVCVVDLLVHPIHVEGDHLFWSELTRKQIL